MRCFNVCSVNSVTICSLAHEIMAADAGRFESCLSQKSFNLRSGVPVFEGGKERLIQLLDYSSVAS